MERHGGFWYVIFLLFLFSVTMQAWQLEANVDLEAVFIDIDIQSMLVYARGDVVLTFGDLLVRCTELEIDLEQQMIRVFGQLQMEEAGQSIEGVNLIYDMQKREGSLGSPVGQVDHLFVRGEEITILEEGYVTRDARITPCKFPDPHYHVRARSLTMYPDGTLEVRNVVFYWGRIPLFYLPHYPIRYEDGEISSPFPRPVLGVHSRYGWYFGLLFEHQVQDWLKGEVYVGSTTRGPLYHVHLNYEHTPLEYLYGTVEVEWMENQLPYFHVLYTCEMFPGWAIHVGLEGDGEGDDRAPPYTATFLGGLEYHGSGPLTGSSFAALTRGEQTGELALNLQTNTLKGHLDLEVEREEEKYGFEMDSRLQYIPQGLYATVEMEQELGAEDILLWTRLGQNQPQYNWWIRTDVGTEVERLPHGHFLFKSYDLPGSWGALSSFLDGGRFSEQKTGAEAARGGASLTWRGNFPWDPLTLKTRADLGGYIYDDGLQQTFYGGQGSVEMAFSPLTLELGASFRQAQGDTPFDFDRYTDALKVFAGGTMDIALGQGEALDVMWRGEYEVYKEAWERLSFRLEKESQWIGLDILSDAVKVQAGALYQVQDYPRFTFSLTGELKRSTMTWEKSLLSFKYEQDCYVWDIEWDPFKGTGEISLGLGF